MSAPKRTHSAKLTIFEGPDGSGKSTAAQAFAELTGAKYVHFSALPHVGRNLARMYVEAMLPALLGYQDVVFDRCWMSETPYGLAFRGGQDRLTAATRRMLERLAMRCGAVVVRCQPSFETVKANYLSRKHLEMLDNTEQLQLVFELYLDEMTALPEYRYDYTAEGLLPWGLVEQLRMPCHPLDVASAGNWSGKHVLVGESFTDHKDCDPLYQWPFGSFGDCCSLWLGELLHTANMPESEFLWVNSDQDLSILQGKSSVIALGDVAYAALYKARVMAVGVPHPHSWKMCNHGQQYPLLNLI